MCMNKCMYIFYVPPGKNGRTLCFWVVHLSATLYRYQFMCSVQQMLCLFNKYMCVAMPTWCRCAPPICFDLDNILFSRYVQLLTGQICCPDTTQDRVDIGYGDQCCGSIPYSGGGAQICCDGKIVETRFETMDMVDICFFWQECLKFTYSKQPIVIRGEKWTHLKENLYSYPAVLTCAAISNMKIDALYVFTTAYTFILVISLI